MATSSCSKWLIFLFSMMFIVATSFKEAAATYDKKVYIVYLEPNPEGVQEREKQHLNILQKVVGGRSEADRLIYHYTVTFNGFAARLTDKERDKLAGLKEVLNVAPEKIYHLDEGVPGSSLGTKTLF
ncbi:hypothetical protein RJ640_015331 [Escallonia rubra]|uniref:Inhibitor I9 domain-containing protein n=1 Tax=Escallonia rubra TaxID=112253 RepID=A0AA88RW28_9ASTE|nr:hypothetical protein RJ640_015331 [Escallonia rubra]